MSRGREKRLRLTLGEVRVTVDLPDSGREGNALPLADWLPFSPTEFRVLRLLWEKGPLVREELCRKLDESPDGRIKGVLATLVGRHVLLVTSEGYALNCPPDYRERVKAWLDEVDRPEEAVG